MFTYWRGSLVFIFQVVGTSFHEGRLDFCNHPATTTVPIDYNTSVSQYVNSQTIRNTNNMVEIRIPFYSDTPWKRVWNGEPLSDTLSDTAIRSMDYVLGCMSVRVAVPLKNPNNVANNVDINVFVAAGDDFEFHTLSIIGGRLGLVSQLTRRKKASKKNLIKSAIKEAGKGDLNTDGKDDSGVIALGVGDVYTYDPSVHHFGESYKNLREMCKRYQHGPVNSFTTLSLTTRDNIANFQMYGSDLGGLIGTLANCYRLFRGPMNFKIQLEAQNANGANSYDTKLSAFCTTNVQATASLAPITTTPALKYGQIATVTQPPLVRFSTTQIGEFQIPFQSIYHSLLITQYDDDTPEYYENAFLQFEILYNIIKPYVGNVFNGAVSLEIAFADETRFGVFYGFPQVELISPGKYPNPL
jgi:hypothetical protein